MPENEFEKKISSEMQELKFKPSEKVWLHVEERIRKKKKRRVFLILFLLAGLGLLGYWQWNNIFSNKETGVAKNGTANVDVKSTNVEKATSTTLVANDNKETSSGNKITDHPKTEENKNIKNPAEKDSLENRSSQIVQPDKKEVLKTKIINNKNADREYPGTKNETNELKITSNKPTVIKNGVAAKKSPVKEPAVDDKLKDVNNDPENTNRVPGVVKVDPPVRSKIDPALTKGDSISNNKSDEKISETNVDSVMMKKEPLKDSIAAIKKDHASKKWKWGFEVTPGISSLSEEVFSFDMRKMADAFASPNTGTGAGVPQQRAQPSVNSSALAFQIGAFAKNQFTKRSSISIGLRYGYYSDRIRVGKDSAIATNQSSSYALLDAGTFYRAGNSYRDKTNSYHFLELPVNYQLRLNKNVQKPFTWNIGFAVSRMIATNAVMYDTTFGGIYYKNTKQLNKTQFSLSTGLTWTVLNKKTFQWSVGPVADIHMNSLLDNPFEKKKYLVFAGLRSSILLNSKK